MTQKINLQIKNIPTATILGKLKIESGRMLHVHEMATIQKLLRFGGDIFCQAESNFSNNRNPDIIWNNEAWEIKSITGNARNTIENSIQKAKRQSNNIILDISNSCLFIKRILGKAKAGLFRHRTIKKIMIMDQQRYCLLNKYEL